MIYEDQFTLSLLTACVMQQNQLLTQQNAMQRELMDRVDAVGDRLWRMERRTATQYADQVGANKRVAKKRPLDRVQSAARKRSGKQP
jgi:hypothetical protein